MGPGAAIAEAARVLLDRFRGWGVLQLQLQHQLVPILLIPLGLGFAVAVLRSDHALQEQLRLNLPGPRAALLIRGRRGVIRVDTLREIAANKVCTLMSRSEVKDLIDFQDLLAAGFDLPQALADAERKDAGLDPATLAWVLDQMSLSPQARLPAGADPGALDAFRRELVKRLRAEAFKKART